MQTPQVVGWNELQAVAEFNRDFNFNGMLYALGIAVVLGLIAWRLWILAVRPENRYTCWDLGAIIVSVVCVVVAVAAPIPYLLARGNVATTRIHSGFQSDPTANSVILYQPK